MIATLLPSNQYGRKGAIVQYAFPLIQFGLSLYELPSVKLMVVYLSSSSKISYS